MFGSSTNSPWLPKGLEFLSGLPERQRRRRAIAVIQVYVDESGLDGKGAVLLFSALLATAEDWATVSDAWDIALSEHPRIRYFKMDEADGFHGEFYQFTERQRDYKLARLAQTLKGKHSILEHPVAVQWSALRGLKRVTVKPMDQPYFWPFQLTIKSLAVRIATHSPTYDEPFEIFFDENAIFGPRAKAWYPISRAMAEPPIQRVMPVEPFFRDDKTTMPLQAADLTAWLSHRNETGGHSYGWLDEHLSGVSRLAPTRFGEREMELLYRKTPLPPELQWKRDAAADAVRKHFIDGNERPFLPKKKDYLAWKKKQED